MEVTEGAVTVRVPEQPDDGVGDAVFYNPEQELNRDLTVATLRAYRDREETRGETYLDATAASGIRGVRAAADGWTVTCCDRDTDAANLTRENLDRNGFDGEVYERDVSALLHESTFDVVDLDPFGTPMPFVDAAIAGTGELLCVTATDTAPLCGAHFDSGVRSYSAVPRNTEYHAEMGLRILLGALVRRAAARDVGATPLLSHASAHYVRTYLHLDRRASSANDALDGLGHLYHCQECLWRAGDSGLLADPPASCPSCGAGRVVTAGPLYLDRPEDDAFRRATAAALTGDMGQREKAGDLLERIGSEVDTPTHYDQHRLCKLWGRPAPGMEPFLEAIRGAGHAASRTHYGGTTFKTTASVGEIEAATEPDSEAPTL
jgi:tRNA (guanine26-N2/guanine27-N2)-dimethyltransferase